MKVLADDLVTSTTDNSVGAAFCLETGVKAKFGSLGRSPEASLLKSPTFRARYSGAEGSMSPAKERLHKLRVSSVIICGSFMPLWLTGCTTKPVSVTQAAGSYEYHSANRAHGTVCFELSPDGSYKLGDAKEALESISLSGALREQGWTLGGGTDQQELWIGKARLPIERTHSSIRVTVDDDTAMYCDLPVPNRFSVHSR